MSSPAIRVIDQLRDLADIDRLSESAYVAQGSMPVQPWAPVPVMRKVVDATGGQFGITWVAEPDLLKWRGKYYIVADVNTTGGTTEGASGQIIGLLTSNDRITWTYVGGPFTDSALANNPVTDAAAHFQASLFAPQGDAGPLECYWANGKLYVSTLTSPTGKWTTKRFWWSDSNQPHLGNTINGNTAGAVAPDDPTWAFRPTIDGHVLDVGMTFFSRPLVLADGWTLAPTIGRSSDLDAGVAITESTFTRQSKAMFMLLRDPDTGLWSRGEPVPVGATSTPGGLWECFAVECDNGDIRLYGLNKLGTILPQNALWTSVSNDRGRTWSATRDTEILTATQRNMAIRGADGRYWMIAGDYPSTNSTGSTISPSTSASTGRLNLAAYTSRRGVDDFVPALRLSDLELDAQYGQLIDDDGMIVAVWHRDHAVGNPHGRDLWLTEVAAPPSADDAYVYPRHLSERTIQGPTAKATAPAGFHFGGYHQATAAAAITGTDQSISAWITPTAGSTDAQIVGDLRDQNQSVRSGIVLRPDGVNLRSLLVGHGLTLTRAQPAFVGGAVDTTARTMTAVAYQGGSFASATHFLRALSFTGNVVANDTITVDGTVYTFKANPAVDPVTGLPTTPGDVVLGADLVTSLNNFVLVRGSTLSALFGNDKLLAKRADGADFTVSTTASTGSVVTGLPALTTAGCVPRVGGKNPASSGLPYFVGDQIDTQFFGSALSVANLKYLCDQHAADSGIAYAPVGGGASPGAPAARFNAAASTAGWPDLATPPGGVCTVSGTQVTITGEASASLEMPYSSATYPLVFQLPDIADGDHVVLHTWDTAAHKIELAADRAAGVTTLSLNGRAIRTITDPSRFNRVRVVATDKAISVGGIVVKRTAPGNVRCYLGCAYPTGVLAATRRTIFETADMTIAEYRGATQLDDLAHMAIVSPGATSLTDTQLDALLPTPRPAVAVVTDPTSNQLLVRTGLTGALWSRYQANVSSDGSAGSFPRQYETLSSPDGTNFGKLASLSTKFAFDRVDVKMLVCVGGDSGIGVHGTALVDLRLADNNGTLDTGPPLFTELIPFETGAGRISPANFSLVTTQSDAANHLFTVELWVALVDPNAIVFFVPLMQKYKPGTSSPATGGVSFFNQTPNPRPTALPTGTVVAPVKVYPPLRLIEINTTGLTSAQIDTAVAAVAGGPGTPVNGLVISDPTNGIALFRQSNKWAKTAALTAIA